MTLFEIGSLGFYIIIFVISFIIIALLSIPDKPQSGWATIFIGVTFFVLYLLGSKSSIIDLGQYILHHPIETIGLFILYIFIGVIWSFAEWFWYVSKMVKKYKVSLNDDKFFIPKIENEKGRIFAWIFYWPWVMLWKCLNKPFERIYDLIITWTSSTYNKITDSIFNKINKK